MGALHGCHIAMFKSYNHTIFVIILCYCQFELLIKIIIILQRMPSLRDLMDIDCLSVFWSLFKVISVVLILNPGLGLALSVVLWQLYSQQLWIVFCRVQAAVVLVLSWWILSYFYLKRALRTWPKDASRHSREWDFRHHLRKKDIRPLFYHIYCLKRCRIFIIICTCNSSLQRSLKVQFELDSIDAMD